MPQCVPRKAVGKLHCSNPGRRLRAPLMLILGVGLLAGPSGCGGANPLGRRAIRGTVTLNGEPLSSGSLSFAPLAEKGVQSGATITNGTFSIPAEKGLPPGEYQVSIHAAGEISTPLPENPLAAASLPPAPELIPPEWNLQSEHTIQVKPDGENAFTFAIENKAD